MSWFLRDGLSPTSYSVPVEMAVITNGRAKAIMTLAAALMPIVLENKSIEKPIRNADTSKSHLGVEKGRSRIK